MLQSSVKGNVGKAFSYWLLTELTRKGFNDEKENTRTNYTRVQRNSW